MTNLNLDDLPVTLSVVEAGAILGIGTTTSYEMVRADEFPIRVLKLGRKYRVTRADLLAYLGEEITA